MLKLADYRPKAEGLPDLLPYAALIAPGIVMNKDGGLLAAWRVWGRDTASSTFEELAWIAGQAGEAMKQLGNGWMLHMNSIREFSRAYPSEASSRFPDAVTQLIDNERRAYFGADYCYSTAAQPTASNSWFLPPSPCSLWWFLPGRRDGYSKRVHWQQNHQSQLRIKRQLGGKRIGAYGQARYRLIFSAPYWAMC